MILLLQMAQAVDIMNYADRDDAATRAERKKNKQDPNITPDNFSFSTDLEAGAFSDGSGLDGNSVDVGGGDYRHLDQIKRMYKDPRGKKKYGSNCRNAKAGYKGRSAKT